MIYKLQELEDRISRLEESKANDESLWRKIIYQLERNLERLRGEEC